MGYGHDTSKRDAATQAGRLMLFDACAAANRRVRSCTQT